MKSALITGVSGQDGSYLAEFLLCKGYRVSGLFRHASNPNLERIQHLLPDLRLISADLMDQTSLRAALDETEPDEVYNLAAQSFVPTSWKQVEYTSQVTGLGVMRMLEAVRQANAGIRFFQASSSEMFGKVRETPQREETPFYPRSPYGVAKAYAHYLTVNYRESYNLFAVCGICFNHESPRRGLHFVTRKVTNAVARIRQGLDNELLIGNLDACRDWGYAKDYVQAMWLMLQADVPQDYVVATGTAHTVRELLVHAFGCVGLDYRKYVKVDPKLLRLAEVDSLVGDATKIKRELGWEPETSFEEMIRIMVDHDMRVASEVSTTNTFAATASRA